MPGPLSKGLVMVIHPRLIPPASLSLLHGLGQGWPHRLVTCAVAPGPVLSRAPSLVSCSVVTVLKFLIVYLYTVFCNRFDEIKDHVCE